MKHINRQQIYDIFLKLTTKKSKNIMIFQDFNVFTLNRATFYTKNAYFSCQGSPAIISPCI